MNMQIVIDIPEKEFGIDIDDKFKDFFTRLRVEINGHLISNTNLVCGAYELETVDMFLKAFNDSVPLLKGHGDLIDRNDLDDSCLDFDFDKVKETLKRDDFDNLFVDHTYEEKQEQTRDEKMIDAIDFAIKATDSQDDYGMGMRNGMRYVKSLIDGKEPQYESRRTDKEIKLGIDLGDEVVGDYGAKGVVVGMDAYAGEVWLSLLMGNHKVPQLVKASSYKTKTGRHFSQITEVLEQIKGEADKAEMC